MSMEDLNNILSRVNDCIADISDTLSEMHRLRDEFNEIAAMVDVAMMDVEMEENYRA